MVLTTAVRQWLLLAAGLLAVGTILGWSLYAERDAIDIRERERLTGQARVIDANLSSQLLSTNLALNSIRGDLPFLSAQVDGKALVNRRLQSMEEAMPGVRTWLVLDSEGTATASNRAQLIGQNFRERGYFRTARQSRDPAMFHVSRPFKTVLGVFAITATKSINNEQGEFAGVISATLDNEYFNTLLDSVRYAPDIRTYIVHADGTLLLSVPALPDSDGTNLAQPGTFFTRHRDSGRKISLMTGTAEVPGAERMIAQITVKPGSFPMDQPLVVGIARDPLNIFADWRGKATTEGVLFGVLVLISVPGLFFYQARQQAYIQSELARRASEEQLRAFYDLDLVGLAITSPERGWVRVNACLCKMLEYSEEELRRLTWTELTHPDDLAATVERFDKMLANEIDGYNLEKRFLARTGKIVFTDVVVRCVRKANGEVDYVTSMIADITERKRVDANTRRERDFTDAALDSLPGLFYLIDDQGRFLRWNRNLEQVSGYRADEISTMTALDFFGAADQGPVAKAIRQAYEQGEAIVDAELLAKDRTRIPFLFTGKRFLLEEKPCLMGMGIDITARKRAEMALVESRDRFRKVVEQSPLSMALVGMDGTIAYMNRKAVETFGYAPEDIPNMDRWWIQAYPDEAYRAEVMAIWMGLVEGALANDREIEQREYHVTCKDGSVKTMAIFGVWVADQVLVVFEDVTERKAAEEQIRNLAYFDPLTNLPNRRLVMDRLGQALIASNRTAKYGALMILDLDNFKALNDTQGHDAGDRLLIEVARRIVASVRPEDTVSRLGGDEYVVMVEGLGTDETSAASRAEMVAEKIRIALNQPYALYRGGPADHSTPSIGVTLFRGNELSIDVLVKQADMALYQAKGAGRNTVRFFNPAMQAAIESRSRMEAALRHGLQHSEFQLFYQPQIDQDGRLTGAEALLRWSSADQGQVSPAQFIPLAEDTGLIIPLGLWVMQTACAQLKAWSENPDTRDLQISINVSARQFRQADFVEQVFDTLKQSRANPTLLKLELTESIVLDNVDDVIVRMQQIKALGVTFSLDDFGTGFSSLSYLKRLPLNEVKIDQSFVRDVTSDANDAAIVRAIIAMSRSLGIQVIAEGVETEAQLQFLKENGCMNFQGYLFGKPMAIGDWHRFL